MSPQSKKIEHVVILGGGTAGWLAANHLAKKLNASNESDSGRVKVTLVESKLIPTVGVGEGTVPAIRESLKYLGISETALIQNCDGSFKQSIKFVDWEYPPGSAQHNYYHHLFDYPYISETDLTPYWLSGELGKLPYAEAVSIQAGICDRGLGPKNMTHAEYAGITDYAYHIDAGKFGMLLASHATSNLGVERLFADVVDAQVSERGIECLITDDGSKIEADFFVDCSGFSSFLLGQKLGVPFVDKNDVLFVDTALALQVPYKEENDPVPSYTVSTAKSAGWIWDIGLQSRRGTGYVYSSKYIDDAAAEKEFRSYLGDTAEGLNVRKIPMRIGYREKFWFKNCAAIGLSQGFVEPLEATGLLMFDATARMLAELFPPSRELADLSADRFNTITNQAWLKVIDFLKLHYILSKREDNQFWIDNRDDRSIPSSLANDLKRWQYHIAANYDFTNLTSIFNLDNYLYVLYGMNYPTDLTPIRGRYLEAAKAKSELSKIKMYESQVQQQLLPHRELLNRICKHGLQRI